jgi:hypothetical protein
MHKKLKFYLFMNLSARAAETRAGKAQGVELKTTQTTMFKTPKVITAVKLSELTEKITRAKETIISCEQREDESKDAAVTQAALTWKKSHRKDLDYDEVAEGVVLSLPMIYVQSVGRVLLW